MTDLSQFLCKDSLHHILPPADKAIKRIEHHYVPEISRWGSDDGIQLSSDPITALIPSMVLPRKEHSQITHTRHPISHNCSLLRISRLMLPLIFFSQNFLLLRGNLKFLHLWPCQKQPLTSMTVLYFGKTMSGLPGRRRSCKTNLKPFL